MSQLDLNLIAVSGPDAEKFLQGQLTCDVRTINTTHSSFGAHCNAKGRIISLFRIFRHGRDFYLMMPSDVIDAALTELKKYAKFSKVDVGISPAAIYGILGKAETQDSNTQDSATQTIINIPGTVERHLLIDYTNELKIVDTLTNQQWHQQSIEAGIPRLHPQTISQFLPHYLNLVQLGAISFTKGCYTGQEIIARMEHRGKLKQHMQLVKRHSSTPFIPGEPLKQVDSEEVLGDIVDSVTSTHGEQLILAILSKETL